ncbi:conjugal transfer protein TraM (plasmid) [Edwardsiella tarda]|uniref:relaxosome protein TraM n=1 Tax=Edwardsiella tarda TaxID=636 RepID=UPI000D513F33|nr:relaxosome protein TraM [Edwardsiella tarda]UCQ29554.1 conjugal transfer protein TraM [Edwardsiella tarda]
MPRHHVYMKQKTLEGIRKIVDERKAEGASLSEANISNIASELLEIGLRVTEQIKNREMEEERNGGMTDEQKYQMTLLEESIKARQASQAVLRFIFDLQDIKADSRNNYTQVVEKLKSDCAEILREHFNLDG